MREPVPDFELVNWRRVGIVALALTAVVALVLQLREQRRFNDELLTIERERTEKLAGGSIAALVVRRDPDPGAAPEPSDN